MSDETYNGWKNYPTWAVNLWLENDRGLYETALEIANEEYDDAPNCTQVRDGIWTLGEARRFNLADHYREWVEEMGVSVDSGHTYPVSGQPTGFAADLFGWALEQVDWHEIAAAWLGNREEIAAATREP